MTKKVEDLTNEQLDVLVAERVMEWRKCDDCNDAHWIPIGMPDGQHYYAARPRWSPTTDIACAFQVDKPEWEWAFFEYPTRKYLIVKLWLGKVGFCHTRLPLDPANKTAAYCRGRCVAALKACGVTEVE